MSLIVKYLEEDVVQNEIVIIINNVVEFDIPICNFNPLDSNFSLTFSKKTEYIFISYVSIEELFRK